MTKDAIQAEVNDLRKQYFKEIEGLFRSMRALKKYLNEKPVDSK